MKGLAATAAVVGTGAGTATGAAACAEKATEEKNGAAPVWKATPLLPGAAAGVGVGEKSVGTMLPGVSAVGAAAGAAASAGDSIKAAEALVGALAFLRNE